MGIVCSLFNHRPSGKTVWNDGYHFTNCARCGSDLVKDDEDRWTAPPPGYRVVWKGRDSAPEPRPAPAAESRVTASPLQEKRRGRDRRTNPNGPLPAEAGGVDRRRADRRESSSASRINRRRGLIAEAPAEG